MNLAQFTQSVQDFCTFIEVEKNLSLHTLRAYQSDLAQLVAFWARVEKEKKPVPDGFEAIVRRYVLALFYKKLTKSSLARKLSCLRSLQKYLKAQGIELKGNFKSPRQEKKLPAVLSVDEVFYLLDSVKSSDLPTKFPFRDQALFELLYATGVRCSELIAITLDDIDFTSKSIRIMGKGRRQRIALFGSKAAESVQRYLHEERVHLVNKEIATTVLFLNYNGGPLTSRSVQRVFEMFRIFLKIDSKLTPHKIRHSFATHLLHQGVDLRVVQELLGHQTIATTEIYTHVSPSQLAQMVDEKHPLNDKKVGG